MVSRTLSYLGLHLTGTGPWRPVIASDKTGTLTQNVMRVEHMFYGRTVYNAAIGGKADPSGFQDPSNPPADFGRFGRGESGFWVILLIRRTSFWVWDYFLVLGFILEGQFAHTIQTDSPV